MTIEQLEAKILDSLYQCQEQRPDGILMLTESALHEFLALAHQCGKLNGGREIMRGLDEALAGK